MWRCGVNAFDDALSHSPKVNDLLLSQCDDTACTGVQFVRCQPSEIILNEIFIDLSVQLTSDAM